MNSNEQLNTIIHEMVDEYKRLYGDELKQVYLYGSYARGDFDEESDIDIVALVDREFSSQLGLRYDVLISPSIINYSTFNEYITALPYYQNIINEGVRLYA